MWWVIIGLVVVIVAGLALLWFEAKMAEFVANLFKEGANKWDAW